MVALIASRYLTKLDARHSDIYCEATRNHDTLLSLLLVLFPFLVVTVFRHPHDLHHDVSAQTMMEFFDKDAVGWRSLFLVVMPT